MSIIQLWGHATRRFPIKSVDFESIDLLPGLTKNQDGTYTIKVFAGRAESLSLELFDDRRHLISTSALRPIGDGWWIGVFAGADKMLYGLRASGAYQPNDGLFYNSNKILFDPYAKSFSGHISFGDVTRVHAPYDYLTKSSVDSITGVALAQIDDGDFAQRDRPKDIASSYSWRDTTVYEVHVKSATISNMVVPSSLRGTYLGLSHPSVIEHFHRLGVTTLELLPVFHFADSEALFHNGLTNFWGYSPISFFVPEPRYASCNDFATAKSEFAEMVDLLHQADIEVLLDVVYNHTGEGDISGPTLSYRGLSAHDYYLMEGQGNYHIDITGTGNTLNVASEVCNRMIIDSMRHFVEAYGVDGFRFDLATTIGRDNDTKNGYSFSPMGGVLSAVTNDPILSKIKLIAEPWDLGNNGYRRGFFPRPFVEWNDRFRDGMRRALVNRQGDPNEVAEIVEGRNDPLSLSRRINFITCHDGFTLMDLVSFDYKHNNSNGEENRDGSDNNLSNNFGFEGLNAPVEIVEMRDLARRSAIAALLLAPGVPMLLGGDELSRSQQGNNNAYCQDRVDFGFNWSMAQSPFCEWVCALSKIRKNYISCCDSIEATILESDASGFDGDPEIDPRILEVCLWRESGSSNKVVIYFNLSQNEIKISVADRFPTSDAAILLDSSTGHAATVLGDMTYCEVINLIPNSLIALILREETR
ncbi:alpha-amylase family glycosyl hydrolase [Acidithrix sp. C25]|uniref:glycogen debranching protein n=1 Tax=Acidithrix sp. C25 TaxID=1671482 RepID=UPI00191BBE3A|nr:alpha-amylase family glycosyl hydrolase [Acidithrix sp. C25]